MLIEDLSERCSYSGVSRGRKTLDMVCLAVLPLSRPCFMGRPPSLTNSELLRLRPLSEPSHLCRPLLTSRSSVFQHQGLIAVVSSSHQVNPWCFNLSIGLKNVGVPKTDILKSKKACYRDRPELHTQILKAYCNVPKKNRKTSLYKMKTEEASISPTCQNS